ncbi:hypothetical protein HKX48_005150 [Thoreauomyces humboldtii]|nr:hypothetical protein HKX48_005150 [Thoreauomyces humboldtii]
MINIRALHTSSVLRSAIKQGLGSKTPKGGPGMAAGDLQRTKEATEGDKYSHLPKGYVINLRDPRYYELAGAGVDRPHAGWDTWKYDSDIVATLKRDASKATGGKGAAKGAETVVDQPAESASRPKVEKGHDTPGTATSDPKEKPATKKPKGKKGE